MTLRRFGVMPRLPLSTPLPVLPLVRAALDLPEARWAQADGDKDDLAQVICWRGEGGGKGGVCLSEEQRWKACATRSARFDARAVACAEVLDRGYFAFLVFLVGIQRCSKRVNSI